MRIEANILEYGAQCDIKVTAILGIISIEPNTYLIVATQSEIVFEIWEGEAVYKIKRAQIVPVGVE